MPWGATTARSALLSVTSFGGEDLRRAALAEYDRNARRGAEARGHDAM